MKAPTDSPRFLRELGGTFFVAGVVAFALGADWRVIVAAFAIGALFIAVWAIGVGRGQKR